jgi:hypothetical protein
MAGSKKIKRISLAVQAFNLKRMFPESRYMINRNCLTWESELTPSSLSKTYTVRLRYKLNKSPDIIVIKPGLISPDGENLPHTYSGERLCLYYPGVGEWRSNLLLARTIVPWISEWLINYEIWLATGTWCGGGIHPSMNSKNTKK